MFWYMIFVLKSFVIDFSVSVINVVICESLLVIIVGKYLFTSFRQYYIFLSLFEVAYIATGNL